MKDDNEEDEEDGGDTRCRMQTRTTTLRTMRGRGDADALQYYCRNDSCRPKSGSASTYTDVIGDVLRVVEG